MITITKRFKFHSAHYLPNYVGKCHSMHGHEWWLDVTISGPVSEEQGMIMDFSVLKETINACVVNTLDHSLINEQVFIPTAENMVIYIKDTIKDVLFYEYGVTLEKLRLYETSEAYVEWRP